MKDLFGEEIVETHEDAITKDQLDTLYIEDQEASIYKRAKAANMSPYLVVKRDIFYRTMKKAEPGKVPCERCKFAMPVRWGNCKEETLLCEQIGISTEDDAKISPMGTCKCAVMRRVKR
jgi:hypothetical protein